MQDIPRAATHSHRPCAASAPAWGDRSDHSRIVHQHIHRPDLAKRGANFFRIRYVDPRRSGNLNHVVARFSQRLSKRATQPAARARLAGQWAGLRGAPRFYNERPDIARSRRVPDSYLLDLLA